MTTRLTDPKLEDEIAFDRTIFFGVVMIIIGILSAFVASLALATGCPLSIYLGFCLPSSMSNLLSNLGTGLAATGFLTLVLENSSRKRHRKDIAEIRNAHAESILKELMPEPLFDEIKSHIIQQPFIRTNCEGMVEFKWKDASNQYLSMSDNFSYEVQNTSRTLEEYEVRVFEEKVDEGEFSNCTQVKEIRVVCENVPSKVYQNSDLAKYTTETDQFIEVKIPLRLRPQEKAKITYHVDSVKTARDVYTYIMTIPALNLRLTVLHPDNLTINHIPLHSSSSAFSFEMDTNTHKMWKIHAGILPYQGIMLMWSPKKQTPPTDDGSVKGETNLLG